MNNEQTAAPLLASPAILASPFLGQYAMIFLTASLGAMWTISRTSFPAGIVRYWHAGWMFFRAVSLAVVFTGFVAHYLSDWCNHPVYDFLGPVSFFIAWVGDRWSEFRDRAFNAILAGMSRLTRSKEQ